MRRAARGARYDVVIDLQGLIKSAVARAAVRAPRGDRLRPRYLREPLAGAFYTEVHDPGGEGIYVISETRHVVEINLGLLQPLGDSAIAATFPIAGPRRRAPRAMLEPDGGRYALLNPGAAWPNKRWPPARFGALAAALRERHGLMSVVLWGPGERALAEAVVAGAGGAAVLSPPTTIADIVALARAPR